MRLGARNREAKARQRVIAITGMLLASALSVVSAEAGTMSRVVEHEYEGFRGLAVVGNTVTPTLPGSPAIAFASRARERSVKVRVEDAVSESVRALVWYDMSGDQQPDESFDICGESERIKIPRRAVIHVEIFSGTCLDGTPSVVTSGIVEARFFAN